MDARVKTVGSEPEILRPGDTCWRLAHVERISLIVDAADYFAAAKHAIANARKAVYLIGWDFDLGIRLEPGRRSDAPDQLRRFLTWVAGERPELQIYILQWDGAMIFNIARQIGPFLKLKAQRKPQIHFRLDSEHPAGACHHQKIVVIDDSLAFCGGIDMTDCRWDTCEHLPGDARRQSPHGNLYGPWHDMTVAVDGEAARALGELARRRWERATGESLPGPEAAHDIWPEDLPVSCRDVQVAIARTIPGHGEGDGCNEIEHLWLEAIGAAKRHIYIENQFLASGRAADALEARLREPDGPEIAIVLPDQAETWLESEIMDSARTRILMRLHAADIHGRFAAYRPVNAAGEPIYVHAKLLIVDDRLVRIGSSNLSNRSMQLDSECDIALEAGARQDVAGAIIGLRDRLLAEHLGLSQSAFARLVDTAGGLVKAIESVRGGRGPTLKPLEIEALNEAEAALVDSQIFNPERIRPPSRQFTRFAKRIGRSRAGMVGLASVAVAAAGLAYRWGSRLNR